MSNSALDPLIHSLFSMDVPVIILCGIIEFAVGGIVKWRAMPGIAVIC